MVKTRRTYTAFSVRVNCNLRTTRNGRPINYAYYVFYGTLSDVDEQKYRGKRGGIFEDMAKAMLEINTKCYQ